MKIEYFVFALTAVLGVLLVVALVTPETAGSHGMLHPEFSSMLAGGSGAERHGPILGLAWAIGTVQVLLFVALMLLGVRRPEGLPKGLAKPFVVGTVAYVGVWTAVILTYRSYVDDPDPELFLALPAPTALMLYVLWPLPLVFASCFIFGFRRFVYSEEDARTFARLVAERQERLGTSGTGPETDAAGEEG